MFSVQFVFLWLLLFPLYICTQTNSNSQQIILGQPKLRNATLDDIDAIADIIITAHEDAPEYNYIHQFRRKYPEEHKRCTQNAMRNVLLSNVVFEVVTMPYNTALDEKAVAMGMWEFPPSNQQPLLLSSLSACTHMDANMTRAIDFSSQMKAAYHEYLDPLGDSQLYLAGLATHADFQGQGAATMLLRSGISKAQQHKLNVTLVASIPGERLYSYLGFQSIANITVTSVDKDESFRFDVMYFDITSSLSI